MYDLMIQERVSEAYDRDLEYCEDLVGFDAEAWATKITPWGKESRRFYQDTCK